MCKGRRKTYQTKHPPDKSLDPSTRASGVLSHGFLYRKNRATTLRRVELSQTQGGPKPLFWRGVLHEVFLPPFYPPPHGVLRLKIRVKDDRVKNSSSCAPSDGVKVLGFSPAKNFLFGPLFRS